MSFPLAHIAGRVGRQRLSTSPREHERVGLSRSVSLDGLDPLAIRIRTTPRRSSGSSCGAGARACGVHDKFI
jgi:hypothetical protein